MGKNFHNLFYIFSTGLDIDCPTAEKKRKTKQKKAMKAHRNDIAVELDWEARKVLAESGGATGSAGPGWVWQSVVSWGLWGLCGIAGCLALGAALRGPGDGVDGLEADSLWEGAIRLFFLAVIFSVWGAVRRVEKRLERMERR
jgi:hypothetical protein